MPQFISSSYQFACTHAPEDFLATDDVDAPHRSVALKIVTLPSQDEYPADWKYIVNSVAAEVAVMKKLQEGGGRFSFPRAKREMVCNGVSSSGFKLSFWINCFVHIIYGRCFLTHSSLRPSSNSIQVYSPIPPISPQPTRT